MTSAARILATAAYALILLGVAIAIPEQRGLVVLGVAVPTLALLGPHVLRRTLPWRADIEAKDRSFPPHPAEQTKAAVGSFNREPHADIPMAVGAGPGASGRARPTDPSPSRPALLAFASCLGLMGLARSTPPGPALAFIAGALVAVVVILLPFLAPVSRATLLAVTTVGFRLSFGSLLDYEPLSFAGQLALEIAYYAVPPCLLNLMIALLGSRVSEKLGLGPVHVYMPLVVVVPVVVGSLVYQKSTGVEKLEAPLRTIGTVYGLCYAGILLAVFATRERTRRAPSAEPRASHRANDLESAGRFGLAARYYAHDGNFAKAAEMAERAGEWDKAAELRRRGGDLPGAAEMYSRAQRWDEAADAYAGCGQHAAAALVCERQGWFERAALAFEKAGDPGGAVRVLEAAGRKPAAELYEKAGVFAEAAAVHLAHGSWQRAAEILEQRLGDVEGAARVCYEGGGFLEAGRLFERSGRFETAVESYLKAPAGTFEALRVCLERDKLEKARRIAEALSPEAEAKASEDERTALILARLHHQAGRVDDAVRILQRLKRAAAAGGGVFLMLGRCFRDKGLPDLAEHELSTAIVMPLCPREDMEARYELARVLEALRQPERARELYREIMKLQLDYRDVERRYRQLSGAPRPA